MKRKGKVDFIIMGSHSEKNVKEKNKNKYMFSRLNSNKLYSVFWIVLDISNMAQIYIKKNYKVLFHNY